MTKIVPVLFYSAFFISLLYLCPQVCAQSKEIKYYDKVSPSNAVEEIDVKQIILPPDTNSDPGMYHVNEFFSNGKPKLITTSKTNDIHLKYDGPFVSYYFNGKRKSIGRFNNGALSGRVSTFFPDGNFYQSFIYKGGDTILYNDCKDSTGTTLATNGNGKWIDYWYDFRKIEEEGPVENGVRTGTWRISENDTVTVLQNYQNGKLISASYENLSNNKIKPGIDHIPIFAEGLHGFWRFLGKTVNYPVNARREGVSGKVLVGFTVEKDGSLTNFKIIEGVSEDLDYEAIRALKRSPKWIPASYKGAPVKTEWQVPIVFALQIM